MEKLSLWSETLWEEDHVVDVDKGLRFSSKQHYQKKEGGREEAQQEYSGKN